MAIVGFTGTQRGMTAQQRRAVRELLRRCKATELHHGDCIGADEQAHWIARSQGIRVVVHPPDNPSKRAWLTGDEERTPRPYLRRNHRIVQAVHQLIATPGEPEEQLRSGTWATIRYARRTAKPVAVVYPDGSIQRWTSEGRIR